MCSIVVAGCSILDGTEEEQAKASTVVHKETAAEKQERAVKEKKIAEIQKLKAVTWKDVLAKSKAFRAIDEDGLAWNELDEYIKRHPKSVEALMERVLLLKDLEENEQCIQDCNTVLSLNPKLAKAYIERGIAAGQLDDFKKQAEDCTAAINVDPKTHTHMKSEVGPTWNWLNTISAWQIAQKLSNCRATDPGRITIKVVLMRI